MRDPKRVSSYRIVQRISSGGTGLTYLAINDTSGMGAPLLMCLKRPHPRYANDPAYLASFETEARFASQLQHPHIVAVFEIGTDAGLPFIVYPFVEGLDLGEMIRSARSRRQQLSWTVVATLAEQIASALEYAHEDQRGAVRLTRHPAVIHRDLCPANILIGISGIGYLTDLGIAKALEATSLRPSLAGTGRIAYCAPERLMSGQHYDGRADLFSLGVSLFEALTNQKPFSANSIASHIEQVLGGHRPNIEALRAEFQPDFGEPPPEGLVQLVAIVHRLLEPDPDRRFASAAELVDALARICVEPGGHRELAMAAEDHMPAWRRRIRLHTGEIPAVRPHQTAQAQWSSTDPHRLVHLVEPAYDAERDGVRVSPAAAERPLASSASDASDPFDTTTPDRPTFDPEHQHAEAFLSPPPASADLDAPVIPTTRGSHPVVDPNPAPHSSTRVGSWEDRAPSPPPPPEMPAPTSRPGPAYVEVELPAYHVSPSGTLTPVKPRSRSSASIGWAIGLGALALVLVPCGLFALVAAMSAAAIAGGGFQPQLGGSPRVGTGGGASSELFTWLGPYPPALVDLNGDGYLDPIGFTWDFGGTDAVSAISGADASVLWVHPAEQDLSGDFDDVRVWVPSTSLVVFSDLRGVAVGIDATDGSERWRAELGARAVRACRVDADLLITTSDQYTYRVALADGAMQRTRVPNECEAVPRVAENRLQLMRSMPGWERTRPRDFPWPREQVRGCWLAPEGDRYLAEIRHPGPLDRDIIEIVAVAPGGDLIWQQPATEDWDRAQNWGLRHLTVEDGVVFAVYDMVRGRSDVPRRIAAFDYETGRRLWDAPLQWQSNNVDFVRADARRVYVGHWALEILDRADGRSIGRVGVFPNERR